MPVLGRFFGGPVAGVGARVGKSGKSGVSRGKGDGHVVHAGVNNVCGSAHSCGCVVFARAALLYRWLEGEYTFQASIFSFSLKSECL